MRPRTTVEANGLTACGAEAPDTALTIKQAVEKSRNPSLPVANALTDITKIPEQLEAWQKLINIVKKMIEGNVLPMLWSAFGSHVMHAASDNTKRTSNINEIKKRKDLMTLACTSQTCLTTPYAANSH